MLTFLWCRSQDIHFSQFDNTPVLINPALTGEFQGKGRFILNYRNQWRSVTKKSYRTYGLLSDFSFFKDKLSSGLFLYNDKAGDGKLSNTQINLSTAVKIRISKYDYFKLGLQAGWSQKHIDINSLTWNSQYNGITIDPNLPSGEPNYKASYGFLDIATGLNWIHMMQNKTKLNIGLGIFHVNQPKYSLGSNSKKLDLRWCGNADISIILKPDRLTLSPSLLVMFQGPSNEINVGSVLKYTLGNNSRYTKTMKTSSAYLGFYYRHNDAIIAYTRFDYRNMLDLCITYDINISKFVNATSAKGGLEISLIYIIPKAALIRS
jgi:type IX secretion system PorP/SprF family membrane protein